MKKKMHIALCLVIICAVFIGCGNENIKTESEFWKNKSETTDSDSVNSPDDSKFIDGDMHIISSHNGLIASSYAAVPFGCYEIFYHTNGTGNILFYDYETTKLIYLSNQPNSSHNDQSDTSWLASTSGGCYPVVGGDKLYLFKLNTPGFIDQLGEAGKGYIYQYNFDGSGKKTLTTIADNESISGGSIAFDGNHLYYISESIDSEGMKSSIQIIQIEVNTGERQIIKELSTEERHFIVGATGGSLILKHIINPVNVSLDTDNNDFEEMYKNQIHQLTLCARDGEEKDIIQWRQNEISETIYDNKLVYWDEETNNIFCMDVFNQKIDVLLDTLLTEDEKKLYDSISLFSDGFDSHVIFETSIMVEDPEYNEIYAKSVQKYAIDINNGDIKELNLAEIDPLTGEYRDVQIYAEGEDVFFVNISRKEYQIKDYFEDGQLYTTDLIVNVPAIITKKDYWNNRPNYISFEDYVYV